MSLRKAAIWSAIWTLIGVAFTVVVAVVSDRSAAPGEYLTGFLIEKSLSLDNLFVFVILLAHFKVPVAEQTRVLHYGIAGAIVLRALFIFAGSAALDAFHATIYVFGAFLVFTAVKLARQHDTGVDVENTRMMKLLRRLRPGASPALAALLMIAAFDVLFAVDSVPAIFAVSRDTLIVLSANAFSLLGMTSLYFLLSGLLDRFWALHYGLAAILGFVGVKMLLSDVWHMPHWLSLGVIVGGLAATAAVSVYVPRDADGTPRAASR